MDKKEMSNFRYDEYSDLLGGKERKEDQFLFSDDISGSYPLEVLWLKWNLFSDLCGKILSIHRDRGMPHLNILPANVGITIPENVSNSLPVRWIHTLEVVNAAASSPYSDPDIPPSWATRLFSRPHNPENPYSAPVIKEKPIGHEDSATVLVRSMERIRQPEEETVCGILQIHLLSDSIHSSDYSEMDLFRVTLSLPEKQIPPVLIWGSKITSSEHGLTLRGNTDHVTTETWDAMERASRQVFHGSEVIIYPTYHVPCDLYSMGMMLFSTLLVNETQDFGDVVKKVLRVADGLESMVQGVDPEAESAILSRRFKTRLAEEGYLFSKESMLHRMEDREQAGGCIYIPDEIWYEIIILGFRLVTWIPGFSFCRSHGDYDVHNPQLPMGRVMKNAGGIRRRIIMELFGSRQRNREVLEACELFRKELAMSRDM